MRATVTINGVSLEVEYEYHKGCKGARDSWMGKAGAGPQITPDDPDEIELQSITTTEDVFELLSNKQISEIEEKLLEGNDYGE